MANVQIPNLPASSALNGQEQMEAVQGGVSVRVTTSQIADLANRSTFNQNVSLYQFISAIAVPFGSKPADDPNTLVAAVGTDYTNDYTVQFFTSPYVAINSPLFNFTATTYGWNTSQMSSLMAVASTISMWG